MKYSDALALSGSYKKLLPLSAHSIFETAFIAAWEAYTENPTHDHDHTTQQGVAHKAAWLAVREEYEEDEAGNWHKKRTYGAFSQLGE